MRELSSLEVGSVSGAGIFSRFGNILMFASDAANGFLNAVAPIGLALNKIPGVSTIHHIGDTIVGGVLNTISKIGKIIGGSYTSKNASHLESEWNGK